MYDEEEHTSVMVMFSEPVLVSRGAAMATAPKRAEMVKVVNCILMVVLEVFLKRGVIRLDGIDKVEMC